MHRFFQALSCVDRDGSGRKSDHPEYDPRTLHVPDTFMKSLTPVSVKSINISLLNVT